MNLALIGYRGTGKTHVSRLLAHQLGWNAVDADAQVESNAGKSIPEIFAELGEPGFRNLESDVIYALTEADRQVIATGGGAILRLENRQRLATKCYVVWLTASPTEIARRLSADERAGAIRPSLTGKNVVDEIEEVLASRIAYYQECAHLTVATEQSPEMVAETIMNQLPIELRRD